MTKLWWPKFLKKPRLRFEKPRLKVPIKVPSKNFLLVVSLFFLFFTASGGMRLLSVNSIPQGFLAGGLMDQTIIEAIVVFGFLVIGFLGFVAIHESTKYIYRADTARVLLIIGIVLVIIAYAGMQWLILKKVPHLFGGRRG